MFYTLKENLLLRGWQRAAFGVVNIETGDTVFVSKPVFAVLQMCNGRINFDLPLITDEQREIVKALAEEGSVIASETPAPILPKQEYRRYDNRYMQSAHWSMTGRCNYRCKHCYMSAPDAKYGELTHEDAMEMVRQMGECGIFKVSLTGGEPLVRKDFLELVDALTERDITITTIYSNGLLVTDKLLDALDERGLSPEFNMSFDGTEGWHDWLRGVDCATEVIDRAFKLCRDRGFRTGAEMCIHQGNKHTLRDSINYLASVGCRTLKTNPISNVGAWKEGGFTEGISMEEAMEVYLDYIPHYLKDGKPLVIQLGGFFNMHPEDDYYVVPTAKPEMDLDEFCVCGHARAHLYISAEGRALPCMALSGMEIQKNYPLILERGMQYALSESTYMDLITTKARAVINHNERCRDCEHAAHCCGGCRACALETTPDDIMGVDEAACLIMRGGYLERIQKAVDAVDPSITREC